MKHELGIKAKDTVTGFKGVIVGYVKYLTGCNQYLLSPPVDKDGKHIDSYWYDESRVVKDGSDKPIALDKEDPPGACEPAPTQNYRE